MTGLFTGIIGSLIGAGIQATVGGIPISEDASKALDVLRTGGLPVPPTNWFSPTISDRQNTRQIQVYDKIEQHVTGAHQVLNSCIRIAKVLEDVAHQCSAPKPPVEVSRTQGEFTRAKTSFCTGKSALANDLVPMSAIKVAEKKCGCQCVNTRETTSTKKLIVSTDETIERNEKVWRTSKSVENDRKMKIEKSGTSPSKNIMVKMKKENFCETFNNNNNKENSVPRSKVSQLKKIDNFWERDQKPNKFMSSTKFDFEYSKEEKLCGSSTAVTDKQSLIQRGRNQSVESQKQYSNKSVIGTCQMCQAQIRKMNKSKLMPCGHLFCQGCLAGRNILKCSKCGIKFESI